MNNVMNDVTGKLYFQYCLVYTEYCLYYQECLQFMPFSIPVYIASKVDVSVGEEPAWALLDQSQEITQIFYENLGRTCRSTIQPLKSVNYLKAYTRYRLQINAVPTCMNQS